MSFLYIKYDKLKKFYNRVVVLLYTRMTRETLCKYLGKLEFLSEDRQKLFFKIDVDLGVPPSSFNANDWCVATITIKFNDNLPLSLFINFFCVYFPHHLHLNYVDAHKFIACGGLDGELISDNDVKTYFRLSNYISTDQKKVVDISRIFRTQVQLTENIVDLLINLASKYSILGGQWILFFQKLTQNQFESAFDYLLQNFCQNEIKIYSNRFNAKISSEKIIISFGNNFTKASVDPSIMKSRFPEYMDDGVYNLRMALDNIYNPKILGHIEMKYKPNIVSYCCIQRDNKNNIRPTVYQVSLIIKKN